MFDDEFAAAIAAPADVVRNTTLAVTYGTPCLCGNKHASLTAGYRLIGRYRNVYGKTPERLGLWMHRRIEIAPEPVVDFLEGWKESAKGTGQGDISEVRGTIGWDKRFRRRFARGHINGLFVREQRRVVGRAPVGV
jgi:hypothetical protein